MVENDGQASKTEYVYQPVAANLMLQGKEVKIINLLDMKSDDWCLCSSFPSVPF